MSKAWGNIGAWAAEAERAEEEEREAAAAAAAAAASAPSQSFPSLKEAAAAKPKKKKMTLTEFQSVGSTGLTPDELSRLPTGPKERSAEEMQYGRLGGGFSSYGRSGPLPGRGGPREDGDGSWGGGRRSYGGGFDEDRRDGAPSRDPGFDQPSRADEADNWAMGKKSNFSSMDSSRQSRYSSLGGGGASMADETDNWAAGKRQQQPPPPSRSSTFGSGFRSSEPEPDRWARGMPQDERPRLVLDPPKRDPVINDPVKANRASPFGAARPREDVLAEKGLDWKKLESDIDAKKTSRPTSSQSSRPTSAQSSRSEALGTENTVKQKPKVNPFGDAKPREVLLEEKGLDWKKIDLQLEQRRVDRPETDQEKALKEELDLLKQELDKELEVKRDSESSEGPGAEQSNLIEVISQKEKELEMLICDLDDKVRFRPKTSDRPGSGSGRAGGYLDRPPSRSESIDEPHGVDYNGRPSSRGTGDAWGRPASDRRAFQGGKDRGFFGSRDVDRSSSRGRW